jgi:hypothetical protein
MPRILLTIAFLLCASGSSASAQEWMPGRVYTVSVGMASVGMARYSVTVIDYTTSRERHAAVAKNQANTQVMYADIDTMASIYLEVKDEKGQVALWTLEGASVGQLMQRGWTRDSIKPGDAISVRCHQLMDRSTGCLLGYVTTAKENDKLFD